MPLFGKMKILDYQLYLFCASLSKNVKYRAAAAPIITTKEMMISVPMILNIKMVDFNYN